MFLSFICHILNQNYYICYRIVTQILSHCFFFVKFLTPKSFLGVLESFISNSCLSDFMIVKFFSLLYSYTLSSVYIFLWICHNNRDFRLCSILRGINVCLSFGNPLDHSACTYCCYIRIGTRILWIISG